MSQEQNNEVDLPEGLDLNTLNFEDVDNLIDDEEGGNAEAEQPNTTVEEEAEEESKQEPEKKAEQAKEEASKSADDESNAEGILAADGKNIIPMSVLSTTRDNLTKAQQLAETERQARIAAEDKLAELQKASAQAEKGEETDVALLSDEELDALEEEFPQLGKATRLQQQKIAALEERLASEDKSKQVDEEKVLKDSIQNAIDSIPELVHAQTNDVEVFKKLVIIDNVLLADAEFANKPIAERFKEAVTRYEMAYGKILKPNTTTQKDTEKAAADALAKASSEKKVTSMSDIPGGAQVPVDEVAAIEGKSSQDLEEMMKGWDQEKIDNYLNNMIS